jgi:hypothetical protein
MRHRIVWVGLWVENRFEYTRQNSTRTNAPVNQSLGSKCEFELYRHSSAFWRFTAYANAGSGATVWVANEQQENVV